MVRIRIFHLALLCAVWGCASPPEPVDPVALCWEGAEDRLSVAPCLRERLREARIRLAAANRSVEAAMSELARVTGRNTSVQAFELSKRHFETFRTANCTWVRIRTEGGSGAGDFELACRIRMIEGRVSELEGTAAP